MRDALPLLALLLATPLGALGGCAGPPRPTAASTGPAARPLDPPPRPRSCTPGSCRGWSAFLLSGGRSREQNAVAHEKNLAFVGRTLDRLGIPTAERWVHFADGPDPAPDVQVEEPDASRRRLLLAARLLIAPEGDLYEGALQYRDHEISGAQPATRAAVLAGLAQDAERARLRRAPAPDLLLYVTDHGLLRGEGEDNVVVLWGPEDLSVRALATALDAQPPGRRVVLVMAQCFSGSFASVIREGGDPSRPLASHDRCGFFSAPRDRPAAGCSPRADESLYDDHTTRFFGALGGHDRAGKPLASADLDRDGEIGLDEAQAAATRLAETQDVPVRTSEEFLRQERPAWLEAAAVDTRPIEAALAASRPAVQAEARSLAQAEKLAPSVSVAELHEQVAQLKRLCWPGLCEAEDQLDAMRLEAHTRLRQASEGVPLPRSRAALVLAAAGPDRMARWIERAQPAFGEVLRLDAEIERMRIEAETRQARLLRLARLAENEQLERRAHDEGGPLWASYQRLRACEGSTLRPSDR
jgi:hypothetical protein